MEVRTHYFTQGNTALAEEDLLALPEEKEAPKRKAAPRKRAESSASEALATLAFTFVSITLAIICFRALTLQAQINRTNKHIQELQSTIQEQRSENADMVYYFENATDLEEVYEKATTLLGMVYPDSNTKVYYSSTKREYVRQYDTIP